MISTIVGTIDIRSKCNDKMNPTVKLAAAVIDTGHGRNRIDGVRAKLNITVGSSKNAMVKSRPITYPEVLISSNVHLASKRQRRLLRLYGQMRVQSESLASSRLAVSQLFV